jgi:hypothetical protein
MVHDYGAAAGACTPIDHRGLNRKFKARTPAASQRCSSTSICIRSDHADRADAW